MSSGRWQLQRPSQSFGGTNNTNGTSYGSLVRRNTELLKAVRELEHTCITLREENTLLRKSSSPETEEKVKRLKRKNAELANIAKRLEERARKLQEANLRVVNSPVLVKGSSLEHYKKAFARQRAKDLSEHADVILAKDKEIEELRQECRELHAKLGPSKEAPDRLKQSDFERVLRESQKEVLRLQRQLAVVSLRESSHVQDPGTPTVRTSSVHPGLSLKVTTEFSRTSEATELCKKRKECESHEQEIKKRQRICQDLENELKQVWSENARLTEETIRLSQQAQETEKVKAHNNDLRGRLSVVTAERDSALKENQRLQAKLENLEQVLKHMREVAERRHQLELEHKEALTILQTKQHEVERLQQAQFEAKKEHEGVVQLLEAKVRDLEEKCRSQSMQFGLLSQELEHFRLQAGNIDLLTNTLVNTDTPGLLSRSQPHLLNGVESPIEKDAESVPQPVSQSLCPAQVEEKQEEQIPNEPQAQTISVSQQSEETAAEVGSITSKIGPESTQSSSKGTPKTESARSTPKSCTTPEVDTASEAEELDIDNVSSIPEPESRVTAKLKVFIARYSYNPFDGPNENPEAELPLTAGEYIYVYGDMDEDGFYEGELMDGRRGLVPSNFIERVSDEDMLTFHPPEINELSHSSFQEISFHSGSEQSLPLRKSSTEKPEISSPHEELSLHGSQGKPESLVSNGFDLDVEEVGEEVVPYPRKLNLIKQLAKSIIVSWESPLVPAGWGTIFSYNIYVDKELRMNVKFGAQTKAVIERLDLNVKAYRIYVQSVTDKGNSDEIRSSMLVGKDVCVAPMQLKVQTITATSADISWLPCNSNYSHVIFLNEEEYEVVKAGSYSYTLVNLRPNMKYKVKVEARPHQIPWELPLDRRQIKCIYTQFSTLTGGPPDAPLDVQIEAGPTPGIVLINWLPVTIDAAGTSNGVRVTGYVVYADGQKIIEVTSPTAGSVLVRPSQIQLLQISKELTVRTMSPYGESADSSPVKIPRTLFTFPLHSMPLQTAPETCVHPDTSVPVSKELPNVDFKDESKVLPGMASDKSPNCESATNCNGNEQRSSPSAFKTQSQVADAMPNSKSITFEEPASVQRENTKMEEKLTDGATVLFDCCEEGKAEEQPKEDTEDLENTQMRRPAGSLDDFLIDSEQKEDPDVCNTCTKENSDENILKDDPKDQKMETTKTIEASASSLPQESKQESEDDASLSNIRVPSIQEFLTDSELKQEKIHIPGEEQMIEQCQLGSEETHQVNKAENHENEDYPLESSRGSDLSDIMEEDEEELGSDTQTNEEVQQQDCSLTRESSLKPEQYETDSDEEFLEKILELPLQKHCSMKLFSIPEVAEEEDDEEKDKEAICSGSQGGTRNQEQGEKASDHSQEKVQLEEQDQLFKCVQINSKNHRQRDQASNFGTKNQELGEKPISNISQGNSKNLVQEALGSHVEQSDLKIMDWEKGLLYDCTCDQSKRQEPGEKQPHCTKTNIKNKEWGEEASGYACPGAKFHQKYPQRYTRSHQWEGKTSEYTQDSTIDDCHLNATECLEKSRLEENHRDVLKLGAVDPSSVLQMQSQARIKPTDPKEVNAAVTGNPHYNRKCQVSHNDLEIDIEYGTEEEEEMLTPSLHFCPHVIHLDQMRSGWWDSGQTNREDVSDCSSQCEPTQSNGQRQASVEDNVFDLSSGSTKSPRHHKRKDKTTFPRSLLHCERERPKGRIAEAKELEAWKMESYELGRTRARAKTEPEDSACTRGFAINTDSVAHCLPDSPAIQALNPKNIPSLKLSRRELLPSKENSKGRETSILDGYEEAESKGAVDGGVIRIFVALFDYNPATMSPNPDAAEEELAFKEGQILKVFGDKDADGFYRGESNGQIGFVPCNMVSEIQVDDDGVMEQLLQRGYLAPNTSMEKLVQSATWEDTRHREWSRPGSELQKLPMRRMVAVFDYDPRESSPNVDIEAELTFSAGDIITVYGDMDEDGFYYGDLNGQHGLAPSNFLELIPAEEPMEAAAGNTLPRLAHTAAHKEKQLSSAVPDGTEVLSPVVPVTDYPAGTALCLDNQGCSENISNSKKKKGFFSKGKKLFKRLGSSKRE
ncbi:RIMS-binding protein 2-like isoform X2 [Heptranchias perlo]|uniref:RIMS-binding protein 2-like isoform X2 n=1 Tax=Heptranchias perlo TaxID=212740 RepID=UPI003559DC95